MKKFNETKVSLSFALCCFGRNWNPSVRQHKKSLLKNLQMKFFNKSEILAPKRKEITSSFLFIKKLFFKIFKKLWKKKWKEKRNFGLLETFMLLINFFCLSRCTPGLQRNHTLQITIYNVFLLRFAIYEIFSLIQFTFFGQFN